MNMSYCRFQNTNNDLQDCLEALENGELTQKDEGGDFISQDELNAALDLIEKAKRIAELFEDMDSTEIREEYEEGKRLDIENYNNEQLN